MAHGDIHIRAFTVGRSVREQRAFRILVVADEPVLEHIVVRLLEYAGYTAVCARHGEHDDPGARHADPPFDLIIINTYDPALTGSQAVARTETLYPGAAVLHLESVSNGSFSVDRLLHAVEDLTGGRSGVH